MTMHDDDSNHVELDISKKANVLIWTNFFIFGFLLFAVIAALTMYFDNALEEEKYKKIGSAPTKELNVLRQEEQLILSGEKGVEGSSAHISIEEAMKRYMDSLNTKKVNG